MSPNINPVTEVPYGMISAHSLHGDVIDTIQQFGTDLHWEAALEELREEISIAAAERDIPDEERADWEEGEFDHRADKLANDFQDDEPVHEFVLEGVKGQTTWLGGALMVWIFESPYTGLYGYCSPCVPGCGDLDSPADPLDPRYDKVGVVCYDVPPDWRFNE